MSTNDYARKPDWLKVKLNSTGSFMKIRSLVKTRHLATVCEEARCPNIHECWGTHGTATFMVLGHLCTRRCRFCSVETGLPGTVDTDEPRRVAETVAEMKLSHAVITMVARDDLEDGGADVIARTVEEIHAAMPGCTVEVLTSDLMARTASVQRVLDARPEIVSHNLETVRRLTPAVRSRSTYDRSLEFLRLARTLDPDATTKSSLMLGLGETRDEVIVAMDDLRAADVDMLNLGQYLQPSKTELSVVKYWTPAEFEELQRVALERGFAHCESGPFVRSSYHAGDQLAHLRRRRQDTNAPGTEPAIETIEASAD